MRTRSDAKFLSDVERFHLRFTCEDCLYYLPSAAACAHEWPTDEHLAPPQPGGIVCFCKEFELR